MGDSSEDIQKINVPLINPQKWKNRTALEFERNFPITYLKTNYSKITASIMDEIYNCFGIRKCSLFDENGQYIQKKF